MDAIKDYLIEAYELMGGYAGYILGGIILLVVVLVIVMGFKYDKKLKIKKQEKEEKNEETMTLVLKEMEEEKIALEEKEKEKLLQQQALKENKIEKAEEEKVKQPLIAAKKTLNEQTEGSNDLVKPNLNLKNEELSKKASKTQTSAIEINSTLLKPIILPNPDEKIKENTLENTTVMFDFPNTAPKPINSNTPKIFNNMSSKKESMPNQLNDLSTKPIVQYQTNNNLENHKIPKNVPINTKRVIVNKDKYIEISDNEIINRSRLDENKSLYIDNNEKDYNEVKSTRNDIYLENNKNRENIYQNPSRSEYNNFEKMNRKESSNSFQVEDVALQIEKDLENKNIKLTNFEREQEEEAIISYQDLVKKTKQPEKQDYTFKFEQLDDIDELSKERTSDLKFLEDLKRLRDNI